jgi:photosystem II stability/assembly factor-like uncharacterized protein
MRTIWFSSVSVAILLTSVRLISDAQWVHCSGTGSMASIKCFASRDSTLYAGSWSSIPAPGNASWFLPVLQSTDGGLNWALSDSDFTSDSTLDVEALAFSGSVLLAGGAFGVFRSRDNGRTWETASSGLTDRFVHTLLVKDSSVFAGAGVEATNFGRAYGDVFRSTNDGSSWTKVDSGLPNDMVFTLLSIDSGLFAGLWMSGMYKSTDDGNSWKYIDGPLGTTTSFAFVGSNVFAGSWDGGVFRSTEKGTTWGRVDSGLTDTVNHYDLSVNALDAWGTSLIAGTLFYGVYRSTDLGGKWEAINAGLSMSDRSISAVFVHGPYVFVGCVGGIWRRSLKDLATGVKVTGIHSPTVFELFQNYPNPFNPTTTISYGLPARSHITLSVYNTLGQQVATLINETQDPGFHDVRFVGSGLASGVYYYRLRTQTFVGSKRMILIR